MRVVSKFLTADVRIVRATLQGRRLVVEGVVKEMMPMTVEMDAADGPKMIGALVQPLREKLAERLPPRLGRWVAPRPERHPVTPVTPGTPAAGRPRSPTAG